jgi:hypothetical protein
MKRDTNEIGRTMQLDCLVLIKLLYAIDPIKQKTTTKKRKREMLRVRIKAKSLFNPCFSMYLERGQLQLHNWEIFFQTINPVVGRKRASKINTHTHTHAQFLIHARIRLEHETSTGFGMRPCRAAWLPLLESRGEGVRSQLDQRFRTVAVDIVLFFREKLTREKRRQTDKSL